jgi:protein SCO1/2
MTTGRTRLLLAAAALGAALAGYWMAQQLDRAGPQLASGTWLPRPKPLSDFRLTDTTGRAFTRRDLGGGPTLVFFGFTHCPDVCPTTLLKLAQVRKRAGLQVLRVLFISVDPQRDTPPVLGMYVHAFDPAFLGLSGDPQSIARVAANFGVAVNRVALPGGDYTMDHSAVLFLLDARARIAAIFTPPFEVAALAADLRRAAPYVGALEARSAT